MEQGYLPCYCAGIARAEELELRAAQQNWSKETLLPTAPESIGTFARKIARAEELELRAAQQNFPHIAFCD